MFCEPCFEVDDILRLLVEGFACEQKIVTNLTTQYFFISNHEDRNFESSFDTAFVWKIIDSFDYLSFSSDLNYLSAFCFSVTYLYFYISLTKNIQERQDRKRFLFLEKQKWSFYYSSHANACTLPGMSVASLADNKVSCTHLYLTNSRERKSLIFFLFVIYIVFFWRIATAVFRCNKEQPQKRLRDNLAIIVEISRKQEINKWIRCRKVNRKNSAFFQK